MDSRLDTAVKYLCLVLPFPPSVNSIIACMGSRRVKTARHKAYLDDACRAIKQQPHDSITGAVHVNIMLGKPDKRKRDLDNHAKAVLDALVAMEVIEDDSLIEKLTLQWDSTVVGAMVEIEGWKNGMD